MCGNLGLRQNRPYLRIAGRAVAGLLLALALAGVVRHWLRATADWHIYSARVAQHVATYLGIATEDGGLDRAQVRNMDNKRLVSLLSEGYGFLQDLPEMGCQVSHGELVDPWGRPYRLEVEISHDGDGTRVTVHVTSSGANGRWENGAGDDLSSRSWFTWRPGVIRKQ
jgi:hypothetical protein